MQWAAAAAINVSLLRESACHLVGFLFLVFLGQLGNSALLHLHV